MSNSMISTVLGIEAEAEAVLAQAAREAEGIVAEAKRQRQDATIASEKAAKDEVASLEAAALSEREKKSRELAASGETALSAVRNISDAAFDSAVDFLMKSLAE